MRCENISTGRLDYYVENSEAVFIDLRSRQEYEKMHIKGAVNIPFEEMEQQLQNNYRNTNINTNIKNSSGGIVLNNTFYDRNTVFIVYCDRGSKSMMICPKLAARGFRSRRCARIISAFSSLFSIIIFPSSICFDRRFDETDR